MKCPHCKSNVRVKCSPNGQVNCGQCEAILLPANARVKTFDGLTGTLVRFSMNQFVIRCDGDGKERSQTQMPLLIVAS